MRFKHLLASLALSLTVGVGVFAGIKAHSEVKEAEADGTTWYLRGSMNDWTGSDDYKIIENGDPLIIDLTAGATFKVVNHASSWSNVTELTTSEGDANGNGITFTSKSNSYVNTAGKYAFSVKSGALYVDFGEFYYSGTDNSWGTDTTTTGNHPKVIVNGVAQKYTLTAWDSDKGTGDKFKLRNNNWDKGLFGYSALANGDFYGSFGSDNDGNIVCNIGGEYDVSVSLTNRTWTVKVVPHGVDPDDKAYVYVLDKYGTNLNTYHFAYTYNDAGQAMGWPGATMVSYEGTTHMYQQVFWTGMEKVIFNNKHGDNNNDGTQSWSWDISASGQYSNRGKCLILDGSIEQGEWSSSTWVAPEVAKYIENFMHFQDFAETVETEGTACKGDNGYYAKAKEAYEATTFASYRQELCSLTYVVERLQAWARANGKTFVVTAGVGAFSSVNANLIPISGDNPASLVVVVISSLSLIALGGFLFLKKKKEI